MQFQAYRYGAIVRDVLAFDGDGHRLMPLAGSRCSSADAARILGSTTAARIFPEARAPEAALSGLFLYFSCFDEAHGIAQDISTAEGSYWHAILHRQEPDPGNAAYWFRRVGTHAIFPELRGAAAEIAREHAGIDLHLSAAWDPFRFIDLCEDARRQPGSELETAAREIQRSEWQLLFDYCAQPARIAAR